MRVVLSCLPYYSHLAPVVLPVARHLRRAGHAVAVASAPAMAEPILRAGIEHLPLPHVLTLEELLADKDFAGSPGMPEAEDQTPEQLAAARSRPGRLTLLRAGSLAGTFARDLIAAAQSWRPDVIVRENNEFGGYLAAEALGLPRATLDVSPLNANHLPFVHDSLNGERAALGLEPVADAYHPARGLLAGLAPREFYPESMPARPDHVYRSDVDGGRLAAEFAELPDDRPLVLGGLGTVAATVVPQTEELYTAMVAALGELPCTALVSVGEQARDWSGPRPANVRLMSFVPLSLLLGRAELCVSHAGFGGVALALTAGAPMVNVPMFGDQPPTSVRVEELGLGLHVEPTAATAEALTEACGKVLADRTFAHRAAAMARKMAALPGYEVFVEDVAALC